MFVGVFYFTMANTYNWFKIQSSVILAPKFQRLSFEAQAGYLTLCCQYWLDNGVLSERDANDLCAVLGELTDKGYITISDGYVDIEDLREQLEKTNQKREILRSNGKKGGEANAKQMLSKSEANAKQSESKIEADKIREDKSRVEKIEKKDKIEVILPYDEPHFVRAWGEWKEYRKKIKKPITTPDSEQRSLIKLTQLNAAGGADEAVKIINQSIDNGWVGLFELKSKGAIKPMSHDDMEEVRAWARGERKTII